MYLPMTATYDILKGLSRLPMPDLKTLPASVPALPFHWDVAVVRYFVSAKRFVRLSIAEATKPSGKQRN